MGTMLPSRPVARTPWQTSERNDIWLVGMAWYQGEYKKWKQNWKRSTRSYKRTSSKQPLRSMLLRRSGKMPRAYDADTYPLSSRKRWPKGQQQQPRQPWAITKKKSKQNLRAVPKTRDQIPKRMVKNKTAARGAWEEDYRDLRSGITTMRGTRSVVTW